MNAGQDDAEKLQRIALQADPIDQPIAEPRRGREAGAGRLFDEQARHDVDRYDAADPDRLIEEETGECRVADQNRGDDDDRGREGEAAQKSEPVLPPRHRRPKAIPIGCVAAGAPEPDGERHRRQ